MEYITAKEAADKWNISVRAVQGMCKSGFIYGAVKWQRSWMVPCNAPRPVDHRTRISREQEDGLPSLPMPRKCPILYMTDLYLEPGKAVESVERLSDQPEAAALLDAWFSYGRGEIDKVYEKARYFLRAHSGYYAIVGAGLLLSLCAMWRGDVALWHEAKKHIFEAPCETEEQKDELLLWLAAADSAMFNASEFPDWFKMGRFENLQVDSLPTVRVFYVKHLFISASDLSLGKIKLNDVTDLGLFKTLPYIVEPMISHAKLENMPVIEIYFRLLCATAYHNIGDRNNAVYHIDAAIARALPDKLYAILVEHRKALDNLLDERLLIYDADALKKVKALHKQMDDGWTRLYNELNGTSVINTFSSREREVAKLAAFGLSNAEIAKRLHISVNSVKSTITMALNKAGAQKRIDLRMYI